MGEIDLPSGLPSSTPAGVLSKARQRCARACALWLQVLLFHQDAVESVSEEALLELCDWCCRKLLYLATDAHEHAKYRGESK